MIKNVGKIDRWIRVAVGLAILSTTVIGPQTWWGFIGLIPIITGTISFCPLYLPLRINTCKK